MAKANKRPIAVNARFLLDGKMEGIGWYSHEILSRLTTILSDREFVFIFDRPYHERFLYNKNVRPIILPPQARHPILWYLWFEWSLPRLLKSIQPAVLFSPDGYGSLHTTIPQVITVHDLAFKHFPEQVPYLVRQYYKKYVPRHIERADKVIAVSEATQADIVSQYGTSSDKICVLHNGCSFDKKEDRTANLKSVRGQLTQGEPYFIFVSALHPRKNIEGVLKAFDLFVNRTGKPHFLLVAGRKAWGNKSMESAYEAMQHKDRVVFTGHKDREDLYSYLSSAEALVYPSFFEGFGLPILEAMHCDVPVITSSVSSMPEVAGAAALFISPESPESIAEAMVQICVEEGLRERLVSAGKLQRQHFSWDRSAERLAEQLAKY